MSDRKSPDRRSTPRAQYEHLAIECVSPELDAGRFPVKRIVGDVVEVGADIFKEGHDQIAARILYRGPNDTDWRTAPMAFDFDDDRWSGIFTVDRIGRWTFCVEAWTDVFGTWRSGLKKKFDAGVDVWVELLEGAQLLRQAARRAKLGNARATLLQTAAVLEDEDELSMTVRVHRALDDALPALMAEYWAPRDLTRYRHELVIQVDRKEAGFAAWYEMFPRSNGPEGAHGTFLTAAEQLPRIAELGFDVVYLPPIHPIGEVNRKGKNNTLDPEPDDVGSPWAIGSAEGGHDAIHGQLGSVADFERFVARAGELGMEVALDYALQCAPDHPWVQEHPDWFFIRPDGSIAYAENPPKKYQDIYPINFWCEDRENLWNACRDVLLYWIARGVKTFRVDNPHTKAFAFWEWCIAEVQARHPEAIFFSEAFTRPKRMKYLAKLGFTMSYTYFTWKNANWELQPYVEELTQGPSAEFYRGNFFANTPDILNEYLVHGGTPAFRIRLLLAGTLLPLYGIYSGFELCENIPVKPGSEEYVDSEKYELKTRDYDAPGNINADVQRLNRIRRSEAALQLYRNLTFHVSENPEVLFYRKAAPGRTAADRERALRLARMRAALAKESPIGGALGGQAVEMMGSITSGRDADGRAAPAGADGAVPSRDLLIAVNLDPHRVQESVLHVPLEELGIREDEPYVVVDLLTGARYTWRGRRNYVRLDPAVQVGHVLRVER
ncbi:MAG TPA: alpha-1,4-glucan--maltose-1-phosphate maltosyltransferase [Gemmatimonadaceae bacterium]|nr:alpha-1,4-glucan--maltose-1-phosphate maltosyltransferase [Gemmatimonadaceae bacterium]